MEILQQLNRIIFYQKTQKGLLVINSCILLFFASCHSQEANDDYKLIATVFMKLKNQEQNECYTLDPNNNNRTFISLVKKIQEFSDKGKFSQLDSLKKSCGINREMLETKILFDDANLENFIQQEVNSKWGTKYVHLTKTNCKENNYQIQIAKPVYSKDYMYAFVGYDKVSSGGVIILKKENNNWIEIGLISPYLNTSKPIFTNKP